MYASIRYDTGITASIMLGDITLLLTGETNLANLSANVVGAESFITSTVPAGWTLWDNVSATVKVFRSPIYDDPTRFKYLHLNAVTNGKILLEYYTDWDNVTHTGTRVQRKDPFSSTEPEINTCNFATNQPQHIYISASADHALFHTLTNNQTTSRGFVGILSHTRNAAWDTVANQYDPVVVTAMIIDTAVINVANPSIHAGYPFVRARVPQNATADFSANDSTSSNRLRCHNHFSLTPNVSIVGSLSAHMDYLQYQSLDSTKTLRNTIVSFGCCQVTSSPVYFGGDISSKCGIYLTNKSWTVSDDLFSVDGQQYRIWNVSILSSDVRFAIKEA